MRKRCHRKPRPVRQVPITFSFPESVKRKAVIEARLALSSVERPEGSVEDTARLLRIALYCNEMCARLIAGQDYESDGLADVAEAVGNGASAAQALAADISGGAVRGASATELVALCGLVDAYEAIFTSTTRRQTADALDQFTKGNP